MSLFSLRRRAPRFALRRALGEWERDWWAVLAQAAPVGFRVAYLLPLGYFLECEAAGRQQEEVLATPALFVLLGPTGYAHRVLLAEGDRGVEAALRQAGVPYALLQGPASYARAREVLGLAPPPEEGEEGLEAAPPPAPRPAPAPLPEPGPGPEPAEPPAAPPAGREPRPGTPPPGDGPEAAAADPAAARPEAPRRPLSPEEQLVRDFAQRFWSGAASMAQLSEELIDRGAQAARRAEEAALAAAAPAPGPQARPAPRPRPGGEEAPAPPRPRKEPPPPPGPGGEAPACPKCGGPMSLKVAKKGPRAGSQFWGCNNYPQCTATRPYAPPR